MAFLVLFIPALDSLLLSYSRFLWITNKPEPDLWPIIMGELCPSPTPWRPSVSGSTFKAQLGSHFPWCLAYTCAPLFSLRFSLWQFGALLLQIPLLLRPHPCP